MTRQEFVGKYLDDKMKDHNLPMSMAYYNLLNKHTEAGEKAYKEHKKTIKNGSV